ncbi:hypothetical protein C8R43DRAFT_1019589 [Mycena crocata]|nr:hypothetical protein C8R43DRAFT_1019589 [Mycena crocata]
MFYVIYVLAILCQAAFSLKLHTPGRGMPVMANKPVTVQWSRQQETDPTAVTMMLENLVGGVMTPASGGIQYASASDNRAEMSFSQVGTFRLWAVNPNNTSESYAMSKQFTVMPNNVATSANIPPDPDDDDGDDVPGNSNAAATSSIGNISVSAQTAPADSADPSASSVTPSGAMKHPSMMPYIIGGTIGGVVLLIPASLLILLFVRRRGRVVRRTTFHRNRMVKSLPPPTFAVPRDAEAGSVDEKDAVDENDDNVSVWSGESRFQEHLPRPPQAPYPFARTA